jgi:SAM-dependent methyltransferase
MDQLGPVGAAMIGRLGIAGDQQHLDIAAGTGEPGLTVARLAPAGHVVLTDLAAEMLGIAARRADAQGITNVETTVCSADDLPFGDAAFDSVSVRFGYMFFPDLAKATVEFARCSGRAGAFARRYGPGPGRTRGRRSPCRRSRPRRCWCRRTGRAGYVPVRCPGICQCPVPGRGAARCRRVGRWRRARDGLARAVLGDDQRARLARGRDACAGRRAGAGPDRRSREFAPGHQQNLQKLAMSRAAHLKYGPGWDTSSGPGKGHSRHLAHPGG